MSLASNNLLKTIYKGNEPNEKQVRMGTVIRAGAGRSCYVQFYGEEEPSQIAYQYMSDMSVNVGNRVILTKLNGTYVVIGRIYR